MMPTLLPTSTTKLLTIRALLATTILALCTVLLVPAAQAQSDAPRFAVSNGSGGRTPMRTNSPTGPVSSHGTRVYCTLSHLSYDDPVVHPGQPGAAHLHSFWGNTGTDWASTGQSLLSSGKSSCEGGVNNRSAYWSPAVFDELDQAVIPESIFVYYKTFGGPDFDRTKIQRIPNGLEMLATRNVANFWITNISTGATTYNGRPHLKVDIYFPVCIAVDAAGAPVLSSANNTSHLSYGSPGDGDGTDCPDTHPYRIPQVSYHLLYDVDPASGWYLASDTSAATQGESLHADYIAAWDAESMDRLVQCNIEARQHCEFGNSDGDRQQLPERFSAPGGAVVYDSSVEMAPSADRTPFGSALTKMNTDSGGHGHTATCQGRTVTINMNTNGGNGRGTHGPDVILGTDDDDVIKALGGDDFVCAGGGDDTVYGYSGNDTIVGGAGNDTLSGNRGDDFVSGGTGDDRLNGNRGNDTLNGNEGDDQIFGGHGYDTLNGNEGDDQIFGGHGYDTCAGSGGASRTSCETNEP